MRQKIADKSDLKEGERIIRDIDGRNIAIFNIDNEYYAVLNYCVHAGGPLCEGNITKTIESNNRELELDENDNVIKCPWHGWRFDIETGKNIDSEKYMVPTFEVTIQDDEIFIEA